MMSKNMLLEPEEPLLHEETSENPYLKACQDLLKQFDKSSDSNCSEEPIKTIKPIPGFCIKTTDSVEGQKIFLNICHSQDLPQTDDLSEEELLKILQTEEVSTYRVPMSLGEPHKENDKNGKPCVAYDIVVNSLFYKKIESKEIFKVFLISIALEGVEDKYNIKLNRDNCIVLKNKHYHGIIQEQNIRSKPSVPNPLITEVDSLKAPLEIERSKDSKKKQQETKKDSPSNKTSIIIEETAKKSSGVAQIPEYLLWKEPHDAVIPDRLIGEFILEGVKNKDDISLDLGEDRLVLEVTSGIYSPVDIFLPFDINQDTSYVEYQSKTGVLKVTCPVIKT